MGPVRVARRKCSTLKLVTKNEFDYLIIGSNPILMLEALILGKLGFRVIIVETRGLLGGSWAPAEIFGAKVDSGIHFLYRLSGRGGSKEDYQFIGNLSGTRFVPLSPQPTGDVKIGFASAPELSFGAPGQSLYSIAKRVVRSIPHNLDLIAGYEYLYPQNGCAGWLTDITQSLQNFGVEILLNHSVNRLEANSRGVVATTSNGMEIQASRSVVSARCNIEVGNSLSKDRISGDQVSVMHLFFLVLGTDPENLSMHKFNNDAIYFAASDLSHTAATNSTSNKTRIISVAFSHGMREKNIDVHRVFRDLQVRKLVTAGASFSRHSFSTYSTINPDPDSVALLNEKFHGRIEFVLTNNLSRGLHQRLQKWKEMLRV